MCPRTVLVRGPMCSLRGGGFLSRFGGFASPAGLLFHCQWLYFNCERFLLHRGLWGIDRNWGCREFGKTDRDATQKEHTGCDLDVAVWIRPGNFSTSLDLIEYRIVHSSGCETRTCFFKLKNFPGQIWASRSFAFGSTVQVSPVDSWNASELRRAARVACQGPVLQGGIQTVSLAVLAFRACSQLPRSGATTDSSSMIMSKASKVKRHLVCQGSMIMISLGAL